jgi:thiol-disulfide isomerase/thioredoxin
MSRVAVGHLLLLGLLCAFGSPSHAAVSVGDRPELQFRLLDGTRVTSSDLQGRIIVLDFWATWCGPCVRAMPHMKQLHRQYGDEGVGIIGISLDRDRGALTDFVRRERIPWPQVLADGRKLAQTFGVNSIPRIFILAPDGEVVWSGHPSKMDQPLEDAVATYKEQILPPAEVDATATALEAAGAAMRQKDWPSVLKQLKQIEPRTLSDRQTRSRTIMLVKRLSMADASGALAKALAADPEATAHLETLKTALRPSAMPSAGPTDAEDEVSGELVQKKIADADAAHDAGDRPTAYEAYQWVVQHAPGHPAADHAAGRIVTYEADPTFAEELRKAQAQQQAQNLVDLARVHARNGNTDTAQKLYQRVLDEYPAADKACAEARKALAR